MTAFLYHKRKENSCSTNTRRCCYYMLAFPTTLYVFCIIWYYIIRYIELIYILALPTLQSCTHLVVFIMVCSTVNSTTSYALATPFPCTSCQPLSGVSGTPGDVCVMSLFWSRTTTCSSSVTRAFARCSTPWWNRQVSFFYTHSCTKCFIHSSIYSLIPFFCIY